MSMIFLCIICFMMGVAWNYGKVEQLTNELEIIKKEQETDAQHFVDTINSIRENLK